MITELIVSFACLMGYGVQLPFTKHMVNSFLPLCFKGLFIVHFTDPISCEMLLDERFWCIASGPSPSNLVPRIQSNDRGCH